MRKITIQPKDEQQMQEWIEKLNAAQVWHQVQEENGEIRIELAEASAQRVLGIKPEMSKGKRVVFRILLGITAFVFVIFVIGMIFAVNAEVNKPVKTPDEMSREELTAYFHEKFGAYSDWRFQYEDWIKRNYVKYPRTFEKEEIRIFPIEPDSLTYVFIFSAENAFGVRSDHSVTSVIDSSGKLMRVVSFQ